MRILALDASAGLYVALVVDGKVAATASDERQRRHVESIESLTTQVLDGNPVDAVAVGTGPGGFSGMRVGIAWAIGYALGAQIPVYGVGTHDAIALGFGGNVTVATDARRHEQFVTVFGPVDATGIPTTLIATHTAPAQTVPSQSQDVVPGGNKVSVDPLPNLQALANYVELSLAAGVQLEWPRPLYVRQPDAKLPSQRK